MMPEPTINQLADSALDAKAAKYKDKNLKPQKPPQTGIVVSIDGNRTCTVDTPQGRYPNTLIQTTGGVGIGDRVSLFIPSQGQPSCTAMPA